MTEKEFKAYDRMMRTNRSVSIPPDCNSAGSLIRTLPPKCKGCKCKNPTCHFHPEACEKDKREKGRRKK